MAASAYLPKKSVGEHFRKSQRKKASRSRAEPAAAALRGKRVHVDSATVPAASPSSKNSVLVSSWSRPEEPAKLQFSAGPSCL